MTTLTSNDLTTRLLAAYNAADLDALAGCYAVDAVQVHPFFPQPNVGREAIRAAEAGLFDAFSDIEWTVQRTIEQGEWLAIELVVTATNTSDLPTPAGVVPATNRTVNLALANLVRLDAEGLIAEEHRYMDVATMMGQLGLMG